MSGATCPACGVAVVPGYVRCPKCHKALPLAPQRGLTEGGTAVTGARFPVAPVVVGVAVFGVIAVLGLRHRHTAATPPANPPAAQARPTRGAPGGTAPAPVAQPVSPQPSGTAPAKPDPDVLASELEHALQHRELWSTVEVVGDHVDVRSSSCNDPAMEPVLAQAMKGLRAAGLTRLRCLEQSGEVVFTRGL